METLRMMPGACNVEVYSVDEAFIHLPEMAEKEVPDYALHIRRTVEQWTGIPVTSWI